MKKYLFFLILFTYTAVSFSQKVDNSESILFVKDANSKKINIRKFNKNLNNELKNKTLFLYTFNDLAKNEVVNLKFYNKPISKYAYENYREIEFYKKALPKQVDFINFQKGINQTTN